MTKSKKGIGSSDGIAVGKIYLLEKEEVEVTSEKITEEAKEKELKRVSEAFESYTRDLENSNVDSEIQKEVITAHLSMLEDPFLTESVENKITGENQNAEYALKTSVDEMAAMMESLDDPYLKERAADYKDIGEGLLYKLAGKEKADLSNLPKNTILVAKELTPSDTSNMDKDSVIGFAMDLGGKTAHVSIIAQTLGIPALVGMKDISKNVQTGQDAIIDAFEDKMILDPDESEKNEYLERSKRIQEEKDRLDKGKFDEAVTLDGHTVEVVTNIGNMEDLSLGLSQGAEGVGLFRTEFLYMENDHFPTEEEQFNVYKEAAEALKDKPLIIRTLDIGGDKSLSYFDFPEEENPFLGWRALRICFDKPEIFRAQLRAILRASFYGNVKILLPMVISVEEVKKVNSYLEELKSELEKEGVEYNENIEVGIMVETPASALIAGDLIKYVDYFSIGTNDLTQYVLAADRGNEKVSNLYNTYNPAVLKAIKMVIDASHKAGKWTGMCGGFAGDTKATKLLLGMGLDEFSAPASSIPKIKETIKNITLEEAKIFAEEIMNMETTGEIEGRIKEEM
ncbi:phosphoenolpyruvate--protein phosphotransferase [Gallicola sp. Sow4_E12]|uniref:phosphoenolpyruvate--protein phosphotransferase n=1 Tax=Gallicola sp. Sow4_E12 TaxID=3438785 RepID=UPI003F8DFCCC